MLIETPLLILLGFFLGSRSSSQTREPEKKQEQPTYQPQTPQQGKNRWPRTIPQDKNPRPITRTWQKEQGGADEWRKRTLRALLDWMKSEAGDFDIDTEWPQLEDIARSVLAHWDMEAASGLAEYNYNVAGIMARDGNDARFLSKDAQDNKPAAFGAYDSLSQSVADYFGVLALPRYAAALKLLLTSPKSDAWIRALRAGGYYGSPEDVVAKGWADRRALIEKATAGMQA